MSNLQEFLQEHNIEISEETAQKLNEMIVAHGESILAAAEEAHANEIAILKEAAHAYGQELQANVKDYAEYAAQEFINENREKLVQTEDFQRMQAAFNTILEAFEKNGFTVNKNAAVDEAMEKLEERSKAFDTLFEDTKKVQADLVEAQRKIIFLEQTRDLTDTQIEAAKELLESVQFDSQEEYETGLGLILETVTRSDDNGKDGNAIDTSAPEVITEVVAATAADAAPEKTVEPAIAKAMDFLGRLNRR